MIIIDYSQQTAQAPSSYQGVFEIHEPSVIHGEPSLLESLCLLKSPKTRGYTPKQRSSSPTGHDSGGSRHADEPDGLGELGTGGFWATTGWHSRVQASWPTQAGQGEGTWGGRSVKWVWSFLTLAARWEKCINALAALSLHLSISGGFVPPADPSQPRAEHASCSEGRPKRAIPYLWPRFLHVPFLQVVSRKLWHQLEQPERREERTASDGWSRGVSGRTAHPALAPGPPDGSGWMDASVPLLPSSRQEKPPGQILPHRCALVARLLHQPQWELLRQALKCNLPQKPH